MTGVRLLTSSDIDAVAELHNTVFLPSRPMTPQVRQRYRHWLETVFLNNPARLPTYDPLVYEHEGTVVGFIGVAGRRFTLRGQTYTGTLHSNFIVHPAHRGRGVGGALFRAYLELPRDFAFVDEVGESNRPLHERLGMTVSLAQSVRWILPLRPVRRLASMVTDRLPKVLRPVCLLPARAMDAMLRRVPRSPYRFSAPDLQVAPLTAAGLASLLAGAKGDDLLRPDAADGAIEWLVERARSMREHGHGQLVMQSLHARGEAVGWYVYYANKGGRCEVLQLVAEPAWAALVVDSLTHDAWLRGATSLSGVLHQPLLAPLAERRAVFEPSVRWMLVQTRHPAILEAFTRGQTLLSRLDGEWCHHA
ncbi:MAG TPA: GNAT family N-acetyltransferase [Steroidobacteraceae bacterium]|nr:GNAT family N-acetyltransferase [Steroidobacteraceae bacterium]